jgi:hypothetical protein
LGEDGSALAFDDLMEKYEEALFMRDLDVGVMQEAIVRAFGGEK